MAVHGAPTGRATRLGRRWGRGGSKGGGAGPHIPPRASDAAPPPRLMADAPPPAVVQQLPPGARPAVRVVGLGPFVQARRMCTGLSPANARPHVLTVACGGAPGLCSRCLRRPDKDCVGLVSGGIAGAVRVVGVYPGPPVWGPLGHSKITPGQVNHREDLKGTLVLRASGGGPFAVDFIQSIAGAVHPRRTPGAQPPPLPGLCSGGLGCLELVPREWP